MIPLSPQRKNALKEFIDQLSDQQQTDRAYQYILRRQSVRDHSRQELEKKLKTMGYRASCIEAALDKAVGFNFVSDTRAYQMLEREALRLRRGPRWLDLKLKQRGLSKWKGETPDLVEEPLLRTEEHWLEIQRDVRRRYPDFEKSPKDKKKAFDFLLRRGFTFEQAKYVLGLKLSENDAEDLEY